MQVSEHRPLPVKGQTVPLCIVKELTAAASAPQIMAPPLAQPMPPCCLRCAHGCCLSSSDFIVSYVHHDTAAAGMWNSTRALTPAHSAACPSSRRIVRNVRNCASEQQQGRQPQRTAEGQQCGLPSPKTAPMAVFLPHQSPILRGTGALSLVLYRQVSPGIYFSCIR